MNKNQPAIPKSDQPKVLYVASGATTDANFATRKRRHVGSTDARAAVEAALEAVPAVYHAACRRLVGDVIEGRATSVSFHDASLHDRNAPEHAFFGLLAVEAL